MKTILHAYWFDTNNADQKQAYIDLKTNLEDQGLTCFETWGGKGSHYLPKLDNQAIDLETDQLFDNQWNTKPIGDSKSGLRVFDWAQDYPIDFSKSIKKGHWLEQTSDMREIRSNTHTCGYCGKQEPAQKGYVFCPHCLDSAYLTKTDLHLLRMQAVDNTCKRADLSQAEQNYLYPLYIKAQKEGSTIRGIARIKKERANLETELQKSIYKAQTKHDGFLWLMDNGLTTENVIYYDHRDIFTFGWRKPVDSEIVSEILNVISEFPFSYEIIGADGKKLSGN